MKKDKIVDWSILAAGLVVQVVVFVLMPDNPWSLVSGLLGMCSVVLCSQGNILTFLFGFGQIVTYTYLCYLQRFYAGIAMNVFYFLTQVYGVFAWSKRLTKSDTQSSDGLITTRRLTLPVLLIVFSASLAVSALTGWLLSTYTADSSPYLDAFTTVPALVAQVLMMLAYREQWPLWLFVDALSTVMWLIAGNYCMTALYAFWCLNCVFGYIRWTRQLEDTASSVQSDDKCHKIR